MGRKKPLRVGIAGCGLIAQWHHIPFLIKMRDARLVAVCDKDIDLIDGVARRFNINRRYTDFTEMLTSEELDIAHSRHLHATKDSRRLINSSDRGWLRRLGRKADGSEPQGV